MQQLLAHLKQLVGFDTRNPPRQIDGDGLFAYLQAQLPDFEHQLNDHGEGCVSLLSVRGRPRILFNFHVDTVPDSNQWQRDPHALEVIDERAYGLGACDIKGAAACMLTAAQAGQHDVALLFSSDEEAGSSQCISRFLATDHGYTHVVVAEPTQARAVLAHRGVLSLALTFTGVPGHASSAQALQQNAIHRASQWIGRAIAFARAQGGEQFQNLTGLPLNVGTIRGGIKNNIIAPDCHITVGMRPLPGQRFDALEQALLDEVSPSGCASMRRSFAGPTLPSEHAFASDTDPFARVSAFADALGLPTGPAVDFWTEAALFSAAGICAVVYGPGDIAQAHTADEWVALSQLRDVHAAYARILEQQGAQLP